MIAPTFDADGSPTEETLEAIMAWSYPWAGLIDFVRAAWNHHYGRMWEEDGVLKLATGGWSANEDVISALKDNLLFWTIRWESSRRGGLFELRMVK